MGLRPNKHINLTLFRGTSFFDGTTLYVEIKSYADLGLVDYSVGESPDSLQHVISARIAARDDHSCIVMLSIWQGSGMSDDDYVRSAESFEVEMRLIKFNLELKFPPLFP
ncbi:MAG: hypothetical protein MUQ56_13110, partial [Thermoleophilia bacterium]|nr:hypothetical protein [Thermoleophilia bacterium]